MRHRHPLKNHKTFLRLVDGSMLPMCSVTVHRPSLRTYYIWIDAKTLKHVVFQRKTARPGLPIWTVRAKTKGDAWQKYMDVVCNPF